MDKTSSDGVRRNVRDELLIDIYGNPKEDSVAVLIDRPFEKPLRHLIYDPKTRDLLFVFDTETKDLGVPLKPEIGAFFENRREIPFFQMDMKTKEPVSAMMVSVQKMD